jgi:hypothetical protein
MLGHGQRRHRCARSSKPPARDPRSRGRRGTASVFAVAAVWLACAAVVACGADPAAGAPPKAPKDPPRTKRVIRDLKLTRGQKYRTYDRVRFVSSRRFQQATVLISRAHHITFRNCVFDGSAWNNISINDRNGSVHHIRFINCYVRSTARMGFECTARGSARGYTRISLTGVTFAPQGSQAVSFDGPGRLCSIRNVTIRGAGSSRAFPWGHGFELNGPRDFTIDGLRIYQTRGAAFNLSGPVGRSCGWTFRNVRADMTVRYQRVRQESHSQALLAKNMRGSRWISSVIRSAAPGGGVMYLSNCDNNDFRGITWRDARGGTWTKPWQVDGSTGNRF